MDGKEKLRAAFDAMHRHIWYSNKFEDIAGYLIAVSRCVEALADHALAGMEVPRDADSRITSALDAVVRQRDERDESISKAKAALRHLLGVNDVNDDDIPLDGLVAKIGFAGVELSETIAALRGKLAEAERERDEAKKIIDATHARANEIAVMLGNTPEPKEKAKGIATYLLAFRILFEKRIAASAAQSAEIAALRKERDEAYAHDKAMTEQSNYAKARAALSATEPGK